MKRTPCVVLGAALLLLLAGTGCGEEEASDDPSTDVSGNQPICAEAKARVSAQCKGVAAPSFEAACEARDQCRAGCVYDHPCHAAAQDACIAERCR